MTANRTFKLALAQMRVEGGCKTTNLRRATDQIATASANGAQVVVLPEAMNLGWTHSSAKTEADEIPNGLSCSTLRDAGRQNKIFVCAGLIERTGELVFNSAVLIDPQGEVI